MMRVLLIPFVIIIPLLLFSALRSFTGDSLSAVVFGLIFLVTVASWFAGRPVRAGDLRRW